MSATSVTNDLKSFVLRGRYVRLRRSNVDNPATGEMSDAVIEMFDDNFPGNRDQDEIPNQIMRDYSLVIKSSRLLESTDG